MRSLSMAKQRAPRKPSSQWEKLKDLICELYKTSTLQEVIQVLRDQYKFEVSKRQLVYRLDIWKCKKYNTGDAGDLDDAMRHGGDDCNEAACAKSHNPPNGDAGSYSQVPWHVQIANAQLAMCDHEDAWNTYQLNFEGLPNMTALARSAETPYQCKFTLDELEQRIPHLADPFEYRFYHLLHAFVCDTMKYELDELEPAVNAAVSSILADENDFLSHENGAVDMVAYMLLDNFYENHSELLERNAEDKSLRHLLDDFDVRVAHLSLTDAEAALPVRVLRQCAQWCHQQLYYVSENPDEGVQRPHLRVNPDSHQGRWKDFIEIFGTLWHRLAMQHMSNGGVWPRWASSSVRDLNLLHTEVLSCICWIIVENRSIGGSVSLSRGIGHDTTERSPYHCRGVGYDNDNLSPGPAGSSSAHSSSPPFMGARMAAHAISHLSAAELWEYFLDALMRLNKPTVADTPANKAFKSSVMTEFRAFARDTLGWLDEVANSKIDDNSSSSPPLTSPCPAPVTAPVSGMALGEEAMALQDDWDLIMRPGIEGGGGFFANVESFTPPTLAA